MNEIWLATTNAGKLNEFRNLLEGRAEIHALSALAFYAPPPENGKTFEDNARIKARSLKAVKSGVWVVADDSGLEVDGLGSLPGVHSARYAGDKASDGENVAKLLKMLQIRSPGDRRARFRCVLVAYDPSGREHVLSGTVEGTIATNARGKGGFGYDPVFIPSGQERTFSELGSAFKNKISHRAMAIRELLSLLAVAN
jgi:XTP/dITP diphosphohydrolase